MRAGKAPPHQATRAVIIKSQARSAESDFEQGRVFRIAHEQIGDAGGEKIKRAAERNSLPAPLGATEILHGRQRTGAHERSLLPSRKFLPRDRHKTQSISWCAQRRRLPEDIEKP